MLNLLMRSRSMNMRREACQDDCNNRDLAILNIYMSTSTKSTRLCQTFWCLDVAVLHLFFSSSLTVVCPFNFRCFRGFSRIVIIVVCS